MLLLTILAALIAQHTVFGQCADDSMAVNCEWCKANWDLVSGIQCACQFFRRYNISSGGYYYDCSKGSSQAFVSAGAEPTCEGTTWNSTQKDDCQEACPSYDTPSGSNAAIIHTKNAYPDGDLQCDTCRVLNLDTTSTYTICTNAIANTYNWIPGPINVCTKACPSYDTPSAANAAIVYDTSFEYPNGKLVCSAEYGWVLANSSISNTTCVDDGNGNCAWSNSPINACKKGCASATFEDSHLKIEQDSSNPSNGRIICDYGWKLRGSSEVICSGFPAQWNYSSDACIPGCDDTRVDSFEITLDSANPPNGTVRCTKSGYSTAGVTVAVCNTDGEAVWEFSTSCKKKSSDKGDDEEDCGGKTPLAPFLCFIEKLTGIKMPLIKVPLVPLVG